MGTAGAGANSRAQRRRSRHVRLGSIDNLHVYHDAGDHVTLLRQLHIQDAELANVSSRRSKGKGGCGLGRG